MWGVQARRRESLIERVRSICEASSPSTHSLPGQKDKHLSQASWLLKTDTGTQSSAFTKATNWDEADMSTGGRPSRCWSVWKGTGGADGVGGQAKWTTSELRTRPLLKVLLYIRISSSQVPHNIRDEVRVTSLRENGSEGPTARPDVASISGPAHEVIDTTSVPNLFCVTFFLRGGGEVYAWGASCCDAVERYG
ncbi:hypothetical protein PAXINDRAFT_17643 [Paxillus involutus ATCC 200175]|uniref:Uncharacterized protein n=1 Tax=Paxillus involutus ATCC 200175 TaxID=664439 RepID=A0A0C9TE78_PAXIN|nr:hypothetical protein PAXINDRAFT_17643 [Paxillus involutus ATCC 200175]